MPRRWLLPRSSFLLTRIDFRVHREAHLERMRFEFLRVKPDADWQALHHFDHGNDALEEALKLAKGV